MLERLPPVGDGKSQAGSRSRRRRHPAVLAVGWLLTTTFPRRPPPEVLDALDRAARVLDELDRKHITLGLVHDPGSGQVRVTARHAGKYGSRELSGAGLLNLLDGDTSRGRAVSAVSGSGSSTSTLSANFATSGGVSTFNISGLASGLDDTQIIQQLMSIEQLPQQKIIQQTTLETTRQADLRSDPEAARPALARRLAADRPDHVVDLAADHLERPANVAATGGGVPPGGFQVAVQQLARPPSSRRPRATTASADDTLTIQIGAASPSRRQRQGRRLAPDDRELDQPGVGHAALRLGRELQARDLEPGHRRREHDQRHEHGGGTVAADLGLAQTVAPQDAQYTVDGGTQQTSATNTVTTIATGLTVTLKGITVEPRVDHGRAGRRQHRRRQAALQNFVTVYNQTITSISDKLNEKKVANPATDADRAKGDLTGDRRSRSLLDPAPRVARQRVHRARPG